ncbi:MAG: UPF0182 family protein [Clostridia bacterium]
MFESSYNIKGLFRRKRTILIIFLAAVAFLAIGISRIYLNVIELNEIGGLSLIYTKNLMWRIGTGVIAGVLAFLMVLGQNLVIRKNLSGFFKNRALEKLKFFNWLPALGAGLIFGLIVNQTMYLNALKFFNSQAFGIDAPVIGKDIGYYVFTRPFLLNLYSYFQGLSIFLLIYVILYYTINFFIAYQNLNINDYKQPPVLAHILFTSALAMVVRIFGYGLDAEGILYRNFASATGGGYVDVNVWLTYYRMMPYVLVVLVVAALVFLFRKKFKLTAITIALFPVIFILTSVIALGVQAFRVVPNEKDLESRFLRYNIEMTRMAYGLDKIQVIDIEGTEVITPAMLERNMETIENIRVLDYRSALRTNVQLQSNTLFYTFFDGDIVNYTINNKKTPVFISAREISTGMLPDKSYINTKYRYTHGYGVVINPINRTNNQGQIEFLLSGLDHRSVDASLVVERPQIYYGELTDNYVIVRADGTDEIDYDGNRETRYEGLGGIPLSGLHRLLYAVKYQDINLITSGYAKGADLLLNRQIVDRVQKGAPFLVIDSDPFILLTDEGTLMWVMDGYTVTDKIPYSQFRGDINYIRNSVKVVVDAYDGKVEYYIIDETDPMINTYDAIYPGILKREPLPETVQKHMKYPETLFKLQTDILKKYHLTPDEVDTFYSQQDLWDIAKYPSDRSLGTTVDIDAYYINMKLPMVSSTEEFILVRPFTPSSVDRHNMVSWLTARNSYAHYGELILYKYPRSFNILGPYQIEVMINQIDEVSKNITLWGQSGSDVYKGSLLVIPIENSVLYVEPIYIRASGASAIPEIRDVIVGFQDKEEFIYGRGLNVSQALNNMFRDFIIEPGPVDPSDPGEVIDEETLAELKEQYERLKEQLEELGKLLDKLLTGN